MPVHMRTCRHVTLRPGHIRSCLRQLCRGMLIKGGRVLDALAKCRTVAFDKTGTLTTGDLMCTSMTSINGVSRGSAAEPSSSAGLPPSLTYAYFLCSSIALHTSQISI